MSEFSPITINSQEELDNMFKERIERAKKSVSDQFADYEEIKAKLATKEEEINGINAKLEEANKSLSGTNTTIEDLMAKVHKYETASVKAKIAHEYGLPFELADRLSGNDEDEIRKDAQLFSLTIKQTNQTTPLKSTEDENVDPKNAAYKTMLKEIL